VTGVISEAVVWDQVCSESCDDHVQSCDLCNVGSCWFRKQVSWWFSVGQT